MDFWIEVAKTSPELGELAQLWWEKPISSAGVERIFSILTHMDDEHRRQLQDETLYNTLFFCVRTESLWSSWLQSVLRQSVVSPVLVMLVPLAGTPLRRWLALPRPFRR